MVAELAGSLPIWKFYGWADMFIGRLDVLTTELMYAGRWHSFWKALGEVLPLTIGPAAVLISVGIDVALGASHKQPSHGLWFLGLFLRD